MQIDYTTKKLLSDPTRNYERRRAWIIYQLKLRGESLASVARKSGRSRNATTRAMISPYPAAEKVIADALGLEPQELFPERYDADGLPNRPRGRPKGRASNSGIKNTKNNTAQKAGNGNRRPSGRHERAA